MTLSPSFTRVRLTEVQTGRYKITLKWNSCQNFFARNKSRACSWHLVCMKITRILPRNLRSRGQSPCQTILSTEYMLEFGVWVNSALDSSWFGISWHFYFFHGRFRSTAHITGVDLFLHISIEFEPRKLFNNSLPSREIVRLLLFFFIFFYSWGS